MLEVSPGKYPDSKSTVQPIGTINRTPAVDHRGALESIGNLLDLPGSSIRDVVALKNPFDQWLSPLSHENRTTGRDLLRKFGAAGAKDSWGNFGAGMALELALDPLTYTGLGALTRAGSVAKKAGLVAKAGKAASQQTGKNLGTLGSKLRVTPRQLIEASDDVDAARKVWADAGGADELLDLPIQSLASFRIPGLMRKPVELTSGTAPRAGAVVRSVVDKLERQLPKKANPISRKFASELPDDLGQAIGDVLDAGMSVLGTLPAVRAARAMFSPRVANATTEVGQKIGETRSQAVSDAVVEVGNLFAPIVRTIHESKAFDNAGLSGLSKQDQAATLNTRHAELDRYLDGLVEPGDLSKELQPLSGMQEAVRAINDSMLAEASSAGVDIRKFDYARNTKSNGLPGIVTRAEDLTRAAGMARAATELLGHAGKPIGKDFSMADGWKNLDDAVSDIGLHAPTAKAAVVEQLGPVAIEQRDALRLIGADNALDDLAFGGKVAGVDQLGNSVQLSVANGKLEVATTLTHQTGKQSVRTELYELTRDNVAKFYDADSELLRSYAIDRELIQDAARFIRPFVEPEVVGMVRKSVQDFLTLFKQHVTLPFPAFHTRNLVSGQIQNALNDAFDPTQKGAGRLLKPIRQAYELRQGKTLSGLSHDVPEYRRLGLTDEAATKRLADEAFARQLVSDHQGFVEFAGDVGQLTKRMPGLNADVNPLIGKFSSAPAGTRLRDAMNPFDTKRFLPTRAGTDIAGFVEDLNRLSGYIAYRKQGMVPDEAAKLVNRAQVNYGSLTDWERRWGKLAVPFYVYSSRMLPTLVDDLLTAPGGKTATIIKSANRATADRHLPPYLQDQLLLPLGQNADGTDLYLGGLGLALEDAMKPLSHAVSADIGGLSREMGARLNPLLKLPIEAATGRSLFMSDPRGNPAPVRGTMIDQLMANSPATRYVSTARKIARKGMSEPLETVANIASGLHIDRVNSGDTKKNELDGRNRSDAGSTVDEQRIRILHDLLRPQKGSAN